MDKLMAGDFDSEQYDAAMAAAFDNDYYVRMSPWPDAICSPCDELQLHALQANG